MKTIQVTCFLVFLLAAFQPLLAQTDVPADEIAQALGYSSAGKLTASDNLASAKSQSPGAIWSRLYKSSEGNFPIITVSIAQGRSVLTSELNAQLQQTSQQVKSLPNGKPSAALARQITLDGMTGFVFPTGFGPGGGGYAALVTTPDGRYDYAVGINFPSDQTIHSDDAHYLALANESQEASLDTLVSVIKKLSPSLIAISKSFPAASTSSHADSDTPDKSNTTAMVAPNTLSNTSTVSPQPQVQAETGIPLWIYGIITLSLVIIVGLWYRFRPK